MDIDFHYYATYVAARFAGYSAPQALTIATSAQMIDENGRHVLVDDGVGKTTGVVGVPDDFEIRADPSGSALHTYRVQMTFQGLGDIGTSSNDTVASIWPVFHFLPGNFAPEKGLGPTVVASDTIRCFDRAGPAVFRSNRWLTRDYAGGEVADAIKKKFRWLCRPHSPLAVGLINNATDMIHDASSVVSVHALDLYLVGVTMHVFIDTWAHQDFVGPASRAINTVIGTPSIGFLPSGRREFPKLTGTRDPASAAPVALADSEWKETAQGFNWLVGHGFTDSGTEEKNIYVGHGQVGHWPDHSALVWNYQPNWSRRSVTRSNPVVYFDAFVHMIWAMYCIRHGKQYVPFDVNETNLGTLCTSIGRNVEELRAVYALFSERRDPWGTKDDPDVPAEISDIWDRDIYAYGRKWQAAIGRDFGLSEDPPVSPWLPGKSAWVREALAAHKENQALAKAGGARGGNWFSVAQFASLPFFRFNLAAKCHYRFVKQQLTVFGESLLGAWADGAAFSDDFSFASTMRATWLVDVFASLNDIQRKTELRALSEGMAVLTSELTMAIQDAPSEPVQLRIVLGRLRDVEASVDSQAKFTYGIRDGAKNEISTKTVGVAGADALAAIKKLIVRLNTLVENQERVSGAMRVAPSSGARSVKLMSYPEWEDASSAFASSRSSDPELLYIDAAYRHLMEWLGGTRTLHADDAEAVKRAHMLAEGCDAWLEVGAGASGRRAAIVKLKTTLQPYLPASG